MGAARYAAIRAAFEVLWASHLPGLIRRLSSSKGVIFTLHRVLPEPPAPFAPNAILQVTPDFLRFAIERVRKLGGSTLKSVGHISRTQRVLDNDADYVEPHDMLAELAEDNKMLTARLRETHDVCDEYRDVASASLIEVWIDESERRTWFLFETTRRH